MFIISCSNMFYFQLNHIYLAFTPTKRPDVRLDGFDVFALIEETYSCAIRCSTCVSQKEDKQGFSAQTGQFSASSILSVIGGKHFRFRPSISFQIFLSLFLVQPSIAQYKTLLTRYNLDCDQQGDHIHMNQLLYPPDQNLGKKSLKILSDLASNNYLQVVSASLSSV